MDREDDTERPRDRAETEAPSGVPERSHRIVDEGTSDELIILDPSVEIMEQARAPAPERPQRPRPPADPRPDHSAPPASSEHDSPAAAAEPHDPRRERLGGLITRNWEEELTHRDLPRRSPAPERPPSGIPSRTVPATSRSLPRGADALAIGASLVFVIATALMGLRVEPFATWYYLFAWYPFLVLVNHATAVRSPHHSLLSGRLARLARVAAWSVPVWLTFELWNLRLGDWYYVGVPDRWFLRWPGVALSFATVLPGIFVLEEAQRVRGRGTSISTPKFRVGRGLERGLTITGLVWAALLLALPRIFFPLVWGVPVLLIEPWLHRRDGSSLLARLADGRPGLALRLLVGGAICGLFWEAANIFAVGKWIYTVPGLESLKLFEMPLLGFVGFPPFALCCWSMARALVVGGLLPEWQIRDAASAGGRTDVADLSAVKRRAFGLGVVVLSVATMLGMDRWTVDSRTPRPTDIPGIPDGVAEYAAKHDRNDVGELLELIDEGKLYVPGTSSAAAVSLLAARCRLVQLRGIGTANAQRLDRVDIRTIDELAAADPGDLTRRLTETAEDGWKPRPARVRVWVAAARAARPGVSGR